VRKGLNIDDYDMIWQQVGYGVGIIFGIFAGLGLSARIGARYTIALGLPDDAAPRGDGRAVAVACGPRFAGAVRGGLSVRLSVCLIRP
jgi:hypothetical protein